MIKTLRHSPHELQLSVYNGGTQGQIRVCPDYACSCPTITIQWGKRRWWGLRRPLTLTEAIYTGSAIRAERIRLDAHEKEMNQQALQMEHEIAAAAQEMVNDIDTIPEILALDS